jgi:pimeloyl-ACP methyl ester carboxylesterase
VALLRKSYLAQLGADMGRQKEIAASAAYQSGDPEAVTARYRIHFRHALARPDDYEKLMATMKAGFVRQGPAGILMARAVEDRLMDDTWNVAGYDLLPRLATLNTPTLVIWGEQDFIPAEISTHIARALPNARPVTLAGCGHFAYLECADDVRKVMGEFFQRPQPRRPSRRSSRSRPRVLSS